MINIERVISKTPMVIADYFTEDGLLKQVGLVKEYWNRIVVKELTDNALDAIEPLQDKKVFMDVTSGSLGIYDNGTGIKKETVEDIYDFENYVSQNRNYITASRGKQGNGLKTIISICYIQGYRLLWHTAEGIILEANIDSEQLRYGRLEVSFVEIGVTDKRGIEIIGIGAVENFLYDYFIGYSKCNPDVSFYLNYFGEKIENLAKMEGIDKSKNISIAYYDYDSYQNFIIHTQDGNTTYKQFLDNVFGTRMKNKSNIKSKIKDIDFKSDEFIKDFLMLKEDQQTKKYTLLKKQLIGLENILTTTVEIVDNEAPKGMNDKVIPCIVEFSVKKDAADLLKAQMNKKCFRKFLTDEIEKFSPNEVREIRKSAIYVADEEGNLTDRIKDNKKIVWFGNECVRRCNVDLKDIPLLDQFLLLKCGSKALTGVLNQIVERGVNLDGKHYLFYTSTTGQMKETEITLVEEEYWKENEYALMCGLTEERINSKGGINMGKYFAAKALNLSNSIKYDSGISIDEVIIVPDFKTFVSGMVNYLDVNTLDIQEKKMEIEIEHMDGAGIFIPGTFPCSCQIRGGWLKGAVFPFDFHKFIEKYRDKVSAANMIDAWGNPVTVEEFLNAKMILTDSQLKMRKYYDSMQEYRKCFKKAKLSITVNNCAHQAKSEVKVAYQPFQTIPRDNLTDETIKKLADKTVRYIEDAKKNPKAALQLMGIEIDSEDMEDKMKDVEMNVLHAAILKYPQLLNDIHVQKIMKSVLLSERRKAQGCKLVLDGFWSYICPDLYAFCQWLFLGQDVPEGLVPNGYIYNHYYNDKEIEETCCLRYPHLSDCEHGIRKVLQSKECEEWFNGTDTIVSSHDLISEVLQADWDGDHICLVHDKAFMDVLERDKYPLFYDMTKAESAQITNNAVMNCLISSFQNENIGFVSNAITKIFNSEGDPDTKLVRVLCAYNNFVIDYFKTQKSMDLQQYTFIYEEYKDSDKHKCPHFFMYAKDKKQKQCEKSNLNGNADRISKYISDKTSNGIAKVNYSSKDAFNPEMLKNSDIKVDRTSEKYMF